VYKRTQHDDETLAFKCNQWKLWVHPRLTTEVFQRAHDCTVASHRGMGKL